VDSRREQGEQGEQHEATAPATAQVGRVGNDLDGFRPLVGAYGLSVESEERTCDETY
jgi:hypothetical protein